MCKTSSEDKPGAPQIEVTPEMIRAGVAVDRRYAQSDESDEGDRIKDIFVEMMSVSLAHKVSST